MSNRGFQVSAKASGAQLAFLGCALLAGGACAKATVNTEPVKPDGAPADVAPGSDVKGSPDDKGSNPNRDVSYGTCDPFTNAGCSGDKKCAALQSGGALRLGCGDKGSKSAGDTCTQKTENGAQVGDDCGDGLSCFGAPALCQRLCSDANRCPDSDICGPQTGIPGIRVCQPVKKCKPLAQDCATGEACYFTSGTDYKGALCATAGSKKPGDSCAQANDCQKGSNCLVVGSSGTCASFCSTASDGSPKCTGADTGGTLCDPLAGGESAEPNLGVCRQQP
jgi:hypothetical protein